MNGQALQPPIHTSGPDLPPDAREYNNSIWEDEDGDGKKIFDEEW